MSRDDLAASAHLPELVRTLSRTYETIARIVGSEVDAVVDPDNGRTWLLSDAQAALVASDAARHRDATFRAAVIDALPANVAVVDPAGVVVAVNEAWRDFAAANGASDPNGFVGASYLDVADMATGTGMEEGPAVAAGIRSVLVGERERFVAQYPCHAPGEERWFRVLVTRIEGDPPVGAVVTHFDVTDIVRSERSLRAAERRVASVLDAVGDGVVAVDRALRVELLNPAALRALGLDDGAGVGSDADAVLGPRDDDPTVVVGRMPEGVTGAPTLATDDADPLRATLTDGRSRHVVDATFVRHDGTRFAVEYDVAAIVDADGFVAGAVVSFADVSERRAIEAKLAVAQRLEALGKLTGGVAHDFNNLLTVISGNAELIQASEASPTARRSASLIETAAARGATMTRQLLSFARRQTLAPQVIDLEDAMRDVQALLGHALGRDVRLEVTVDPDVGAVRVDAAGLENALLNLALNARDAMPDGGTVQVTVRGVDGRAAGAVEIEVRDTGTGIAPSVIGRVFEPFFTTKPLDQGTGMGLSMVYGFVGQSGGDIRVASTQGEGATFTLTLPRYAGPPSTLVLDADADRPPVGGAETVLVVDDEEYVRGFARAVLEALGYRVLEAPAAAEALRVLEDHDEVALLFSDVTMPGAMDGVRLAEEARLRWPRLALLLTSGYSDRFAGRDDAPDLLAKPYAGRELARWVRAALDARPSDDLSSAVHVPESP